MKKKLIILLLFLLSCALSLNARASNQALLRDGLVFRGAVGKLIGPDSNDTWTFEVNSPINDNGLAVEAGTKLELLPSSALEMMIADVKTHSSAIYQLWNAKVTKYKGKNYIFPSIFIRINPPSQNQVSEEGKTQKNAPSQIPSVETTEPNSTSNDANDSLSLPPEVIERLNAAREKMTKTGQRIPDSKIVTIDTVQQELERKMQSNPDKVLLDKFAILIRHEKENFEFTLDSIGRNVDQTSLKVLPCEVLEQVELRQSESPEPLRFKISGLVTKYKGNNYLLLYKATQIYSLGNFPG
jgi:hypothetical protein